MHAGKSLGFCQILTFRMDSLQEWFDDANSISFGRSSNVNNGRIKSIKNGSSQNSHARSLKSDIWGIILSAAITHHCNFGWRIANEYSGLPIKEEESSWNLQQ